MAFHQRIVDVLFLLAAFGAGVLCGHSAGHAMTRVTGQAPIDAVQSRGHSGAKWRTSAFGRRTRSGRVYRRAVVAPGGVACGHHGVGGGGADSLRDRVVAREGNSVACRL
jgi:hypothetical protein